ncbi:hypothetical protein Y023_4766 [Burkholderia pseudomallei A79D]|nr:hypothetical protein Y023_4766 [Burkholderia pseudomallei A79D]KGX98192.1 hypothetical protein X997_4523 [Burkholderia pseudomallei A79C]
MRWARFRSGGSSVDERDARVRAVGASRRWAAGSPRPNLGAPEVRPSMSDVAARDPASILDSGCPTSNVERRTPNAERRMSNAECRMSNAEHEAPDAFECRVRQRSTPPMQHGRTPPFRRTDRFAAGAAHPCDVRFSPRHPRGNRLYTLLRAALIQR